MKVNYKSLFIVSVIIGVLLIIGILLIIGMKSALNYKHLDWYKLGCGHVPDRTEFLTEDGDKFTLSSLNPVKCHVLGTVKSIHGTKDTSIHVNSLYVKYEN